MSGQQIGTLAGVLIGVAAVALAPGTFGISLAAYTAAASIGGAVGGLAGGLYDTATADDSVTRQATIADLRLQTSTLGQTIPQLFGRGRLAGNIFWATDKKVTEHSESSSAGKGGGPSNVSVTKTYSISMAIGLCDTHVTGPMVELIRAWRNATLVYDIDEQPGLPVILQWTFYPGDNTQLPDPTIEAAEGVGNVPAYRYLCYIVMKDEDLGRSGQVAQYSFLIRQADFTTNLVTVITDLCTASGISGDALDVSGIPDAGVELILVSIEATRAPLEHLAQAYRFYGLESGQQYVFREVGAGPVVATIPEAHLGTGEEHPVPDGLANTRVTNLELPTTFYVVYTDPAQLYQKNTQPSQVILPPSGRENPKSVALVPAIGADRARHLADEFLINAWNQRETLHDVVSRRYAMLEPGDKLLVSARGLTYPVTLHETSYGQPGLVELAGTVTGPPRAGVITTEMVVFSTSNLRHAVTAAPGVVVPGAQVPIMGPLPTTPLLLNLPVLDTSDQDPRYHVAYIGTHVPWEGGVLYRSVDGSATFQMLDAASLESTTGTVALALAAPADWTVLDAVTTFTVVLHHGTLTTINAAANAAGVQRVMVGSELVYVGTATLGAPNTYTCSQLWRGRQGTELDVATHGVNEYFVLLNPTVHKIGMTIADRGVALPYKVATIGQPIAAAIPVTFTPTALNLIPWAVLPPLASRPVQDWQIRWMTRSRFNTGGFDTDFVGFRVTIFSDNTFTVIKRTINTSGGYAMDATVLKGLNYLAADQIFDFGSVQAALYFTVAQVGNAGVSRSVHMTSTDLVTVQGAIEPIVMPSLTWVHVTGTTQAMAVNTGYIADNAALVTLTLPATAALGDLLEVVGLGSGGWRIAQNAGQTIHVGRRQTTVGVGGSLTANHRYDTVRLVCVVLGASTEWDVDSFA